MSTARVDILMEKGSDEALDTEFYALSGGIWLEEQGGSLLMKCYPPDAEAFLAYLRVSRLSEVRVTMVQEEERDYVALVRQHFTPVRIGSVTILPPWRKTKRKGAVLVIEPGMAFGTGRHESTKLMIRMMAHVDMGGKRVLDLGSGSAILSLYARLLGARPVVAVDNDPLAGIAAKKSCSLNRANDVLIACAGPEGIKGRFDILLANLDFDTFKTHAREIARLVDEGGYLIASGIETQHASRAALLFKPMTLVRKRRMRDWCAFLFRRGG